MKLLVVKAAATAVALSFLLPDAAVAAPKPSVTVNDVVVSESAGTATFRIRVSPRPATCCALSVDWATANGTATAPDDYSSRSGTVTLTRTATSAVVTVPIAPDAVDEANETFTVNLSNLVGTPGKIGDAQGVGTITDDDVSGTLSIDNVFVGEGDAGTTTATFTVTLSAPSGLSASVHWATADGTAAQPSDYAAGSGTLTIPAGETSGMIDVTVNGDTALEFDEVFHVDLSAPTNATIADAQGIGTIVDDEAAPVASIDDVSVAEGDAGTATMTFTVTLSRAGIVQATVGWATADGTAVQPTDYASGAGTVTFAAGDVSEPVVVTVSGDTLHELDETLHVTLSAPAAATVGAGEGIGTIEDDDPLPEVAISDVTVAEGNAGATNAVFDVTLSAASGAPASVAWATSDGTATAGSDYGSGSGTVTFAPGDVAETVSVTVDGDTVDEPDESFLVDLGAPTGASIADVQGVGTITDDDKIPTALTLRVLKRTSTVIGVGLLEPAAGGWTVTVTLQRRRANGTYVRLRTKTVTVRKLRDRDGDGLNEGAYRAGFARPSNGTFRMVARFAGNATHRASTKRLGFTLP